MDFGLFDEASAEQAARSWIDVQHFFSAPYYVISYCVSNDAALQIYQLEQETPGAGLKAFSRPAVCRAGVDVPRHAAGREPDLAV